MQKFLTLTTYFLLVSNTFAQNFGDFASAVLVGECFSENFYNLTGGGANCINTNCSILFDGQNFGSYIQNSGELYLRGAEIKTWKNAGGNVCGATLNYRIYPTGSPSGAFSSFNLPFKSNCCGATFCDGLGPCGGNDQKWSEENLSPVVDLTAFVPGNWSVEVFVSYTGDDFSSSGCGTTKYISNGGFNYVANFTILAGSGTSCTVLAADLTSLSASCVDDFVQVEWDIQADQLTQFIALEKSEDGLNWNEIFRSEDYQLAQVAPLTYFEDRSVPSSDVYYRLVEHEVNGNTRFFDVIYNECEYDAEQYSIPNSIQGDLYLIVQGNDSNAPFQLEIFDASGKVIYQREIDHNGQQNALYPIENFNVASGTFIARVSRSNTTLQHILFVH